MIRLLKTKNLFIYEQLLLEEALWRCSTEQYCIINTNSLPAIVLGATNQVDQMVLESHSLFESMPIIRRYSAGGAVVIDQETIFLTFIISKDRCHCAYDPKAYIDFVGEILKKAFFPISIEVCEHDFVIDGCKVGGNAASVSKDRLVHHVSLLYEYQETYMSLLQTPTKQPQYRDNRPHHTFCSRLRPYFLTKENCIERIVQAIAFFWKIQDISLEAAKMFLDHPHRKTVFYVKSPKESLYAVAAV